MKITYLKPLDGVRAIAALSIMWLHYAADLRDTNPLTTFFHKTYSLFQTSVPLFFLLSGFLITRILLSTKEDKGYFKNFYAKRALRIFPLYYLYLFLIYFAVPLLLHMPALGWKDTWPSFFYLQNIKITFQKNSAYFFNKHLWSLAVEEHFYLLWPLLIYYLSTRNIKRLIYFILFAEIVLRYIFLKNGIQVYYFTFTRLDELCMGALLAIRELEGKRITKNNVFVFCVLLAAGLAAWLAFSHQRSDVVQLLSWSLFAMLFYVFVGFVALNDNKFLNKILSWKPLVYTGKISYGLYMYHLLCCMLIKKLVRPENQFVGFLWIFGSGYAVASASYFLFELQFLKFKKYFTGRKDIRPKLAS